jgi:hypothetical protein
MKNHLRIGLSFALVGFVSSIAASAQLERCTEAGSDRAPPACIKP